MKPTRASTPQDLDIKHTNDPDIKHTRDTSTFGITTFISELIDKIISELIITFLLEGFIIPAVTKTLSYLYDFICLIPLSSVYFIDWLLGISPKPNALSHKPITPFYSFKTSHLYVRRIFHYSAHFLYTSCCLSALTFCFHTLLVQVIGILPMSLIILGYTLSAYACGRSLYLTDCKPSTDSHSKAPYWRGVLALNSCATYAAVLFQPLKFMVFSKCLPMLIALCLLTSTTAVCAEAFRLAERHTLLSFPLHTLVPFYLYLIKPYCYFNTLWNVSVPKRWAIRPLGACNLSEKGTSKTQPPQTTVDQSSADSTPCPKP